MAELYLEDLKVGQRFVSESLVLDESAIRAFAAEYDPQPFHLDPEAAKHTLLAGLAASGWHTAALTMRLLVASLPISGGLIGAGGEITWPRPTRPGDRLRVETEIIAVTPSKTRPERGTATIRIETLNQHGEPVQVATMRSIVPRRA